MRQTNTQSWVEKGVAIQLSDVSLRFRTRQESVVAVTNLNGTIQPGEFIAIIGASGCGKSTALKMVAGLLTPSTGSIQVAGGTPQQARIQKQIGMVFQKPILLPWRTVLHNVELLMEVGTASPAAHNRQRALAMLDLVGLAKVADRYPGELSGGMQQRVAIARALALDPPILLMDEPFGALDAITRDALNAELLQLTQATRKTVVLVTHSIQEAVLLADRLWVMSPHPGTVICDLTIDLPRPRGSHSRRLPRFMEWMEEVEAILADASRAGRA